MARTAEEINALISELQAELSNITASASDSPLPAGAELNSTRQADERGSTQTTGFIDSVQDTVKNVPEPVKEPAMSAEARKEMDRKIAVRDNPQPAQNLADAPVSYVPNTPYQLNNDMAAATTAVANAAFPTAPVKVPTHAENVQAAKDNFAASQQAKAQEIQKLNSEAVASNEAAQMAAYTEGTDLAASNAKAEQTAAEQTAQLGMPEASSVLDPEAILTDLRNEDASKPSPREDAGGVVAKAEVIPEDQYSPEAIQQFAHTHGSDFDPNSDDDKGKIAKLEALLKDPANKGASPDRIALQAYRMA